MGARCELWPGQQGGDWREQVKMESFGGADRAQQLRRPPGAAAPTLPLALQAFCSPVALPLFASPGSSVYNRPAP
jgi:hypothetical protein